MRLQTYRGYRIRASDKSLVFRFSAGLLLLLFLAVVMLLNLKSIITTDWKAISLFEDGSVYLPITPYRIVTIIGDVDDEKMKNNIGLKFAFRSTDIKEIKNTLEFFGVDKEDEGNQKRLRDLENGQCLFQDLYGRVGVIQIHPVFADLFHAFDTRPPVQTEEMR